MMDGMEEKLNAILGNPEMMSQLMTMAQSLGGSQQKEPQAEKNEPGMSLPGLPQGIDMQMLQKIAGIAAQSNIDNHQQLLLKALSPYLQEGRIQKLEKAMRAAKIAGLATTVLGNGFPLLQMGR